MVSTSMDSRSSLTRLRTSRGPIPSSFAISAVDLTPTEVRSSRSISSVHSVSSGATTSISLEDKETPSRYQLRSNYITIGTEKGFFNQDLRVFHSLSPMNLPFNIPLRLPRSEEHTSELQSRGHLVCRLLLE